LECAAGVSAGGSQWACPVGRNGGGSGLQSLRENWKQNSRSLHYATPDFLSNLVALAKFMRLSLRKAAHAAMSSAAWQEIRVRSGRDDNSIARKWPQKRSQER
jgi:hypothetical protein